MCCKKITFLLKWAIWWVYSPVSMQIERANDGMRDKISAVWPIHFYGRVRMDNAVKGFMMQVSAYFS